MPIILRRRRVYLAGPGVFRPDAAAFGAELKTICSAHQLDAIWPLDNDATEAEEIFLRNVTSIRASDAVVADLSPFRGPHMDCGTAFELGLALACGKPMFAWSPHREPLAHRCAVFPPREGMQPHDAGGWLVENFDLAENLMIAVPAGRIHANAAEAIAAAAAVLIR